MCWSKTFVNTVYRDAIVVNINLLTYTIKLLETLVKLPNMLESHIINM